MLSDASVEAEQLAETAAVRICWDQWATLGASARGGGSAGSKSIIDPEALILLSVSVWDSEKRLGDMVRWWASVGTPLTSVQRFRTVSKDLPPTMADRATAGFATLAVEAGHRRWKRYAQGHVPPDWIRSDRSSPPPDFRAPPALWPRLRAGFGVGTKADALVFLIGQDGASASVSQIAAATHYTKVAIRNAVSDMALARLVSETEWHPAEYLAPVGPWAALLELAPEPTDTARPGPSLPVWRYWAGLFSFLAWVIDWSRRAGSAVGLQEHAVASEAREIVRRHSRVLEMEQIPVPSMDGYRGKKAALGLLETTRSLATWLESN